MREVNNPSPDPSPKRGGEKRPLSLAGKGLGVRLLLQRHLVAFAHLIPVDHVPPGLEVVGAAVLVVEVVGVLPDIDAEDRELALHERAILVGGAEDLEMPAIDDEPAPAAAEALGAGVVDVG